MTYDSGVLQPGTVFGRDFCVVRALKSGGMGSVYVVDQLSTGRQRALKVLNPDLAQDPSTRERFVLEARAASQIDSDHVVEIVTAGVDEASGAPYLVMELLRGEELSDAMDRMGALPIGDVAEVLSQVGHALERAHTAGIVHRDLKPQNIFLAASRRKDSPFTAKILDFGIAKLVADNQKTSTQPLGSPLFMSPEQTDRKGRITPASDVWALGLITFKLLTGKDFWQESSSLPQLLREIVVDPIPFASQRATELGMTHALPVGFDAWFARCVTREMEARFPDAGACVRAFVELVEPGAPSGKLTVSQVVGAQASLAGLTGQGTGMGASAYAGTGQANARMTGPGAPPALPPPAMTHSHQGAAPAITGAAGLTGAPIVSTGPSHTAATPEKKGIPKILFALPIVIGAAIGIGVFLQQKGKDPAPGAGTTAAVTATGSSAPTAPSASATVAPAGSCPNGLIAIPGGKMWMGARDLIDAGDAKPPHQVIVSSFCIDRTEVTVDAYQACVDKGECERALDHVSWPNISEQAKKRYTPFCNAGKSDKGNHPINCVAWPMADIYCKWKGLRLPTEAEWELAARGASQKKYPWGDEPPSGQLLNACGAECAAWGKTQKEERKTMYADDDGWVSTAPVGSYPKGASAQGVLDLAGNVWEWTSDFYAPYAETDPQNPPQDPKGPPQGEKRVLRGGDYFGVEPDWSRPAYRWKTDPNSYNHAIGFRCAK